MYGVNTSSVIINSGGRTGEFAEDSADITPKRRGIYNSGYDVHVTQAGSLAKLLPKGFDLITDANSSPSKPALKKNKRRHTVRKQSQKNKGEGGSIQIKEWAYKASFKWAKLNCSVECATSSMSGDRKSVV